jgi:uncharacterized membrane protein YecN with MAPEG domain
MAHLGRAAKFAGGVLACGVLLHVSLLYGGLAALLVTLLGGNVSRLRGKLRAGLGASLPNDLVRPHRAHGNAAEWVPLWLALPVALELSGRVLHAGGLYRRSKLSLPGAGFTYLVLLVMGAWALTLGLAG